MEDLIAHYASLERDLMRGIRRAEENKKERVRIERAEAMLHVARMAAPPSLKDVPALVIGLLKQLPAICQDHSLLALPSECRSPDVLNYALAHHLIVLLTPQAFVPIDGAADITWRLLDYQLLAKPQGIEQVLAFDSCDLGEGVPEPCIRLSSRGHALAAEARLVPTSRRLITLVSLCKRRGVSRSKVWNLIHVQKVLNDYRPNGNKRGRAVLLDEAEVEEAQRRGYL